MPDIHFTVPFINEVKTVNGWKQDGEAEDSYSLIRCHFVLRGDRQMSPSMKKGEIVGGSNSLLGVTQKLTLSSEYEVTTVSLVESVQESLKESEAVSEFVSSLSAGINLAEIGKLSSGIKDSTKTSLKTSFKDTFKVQVSETNRVKKTVTREITIDPTIFGPDASLVLAKAYNKHAYDLYLVFLDYLFIEYKRPPLGVRLKRNKIPAIKGNRHPNIVRLDLPLASLVFWKQVPDTLLQAKEEDYSLEVEDPFEVQIADLTQSKRLPVTIPPKPSLYDISETVFPRKKWGLL